MNKVYIVTHGCYSDYDVNAVFSTEEKAKEYIDAVADDNEYNIEECEIDAENIEYSDGIYQVYVNIKDGNTIFHRKYDISDSVQEELNCFQLQYDDCLTMYLKSDSIERAKKVASERWMQIKAMEEIAFPYLRKAVIRDKYDTILFPRYNFFTKEIVLLDNEKLELE